MSCERFEIPLLDAADGMAPSAELHQHLQGCCDCQASLEELDGAMTALGSLAKLQVPADLSLKTNAAVMAQIDGGGLRNLTLAIVLGLASAAASLAVLGFRVDLSGQPAEALLAGAMAWTLLFVLAFWTVLSERHQSARPVVLSGLGAAGLFFVADHFLPMTTVVQFCYRSSLANEWLGVAGLQIVFFGFGALYALVPLFLLSATTAKKQAEGPLRRGVVAGGMFFFLLSPAIFLQCSAFTFGALVAWLGGAILGSAAGGVAGYWVAARRHA